MMLGRSSRNNQIGVIGVDRDGYAMTGTVNGPIGIVGADDAAVAVGIAAIIAWASTAAVTIGAAIGLSAAMSIAIATTLVMAGIAAGTKVVDHWVSELTADDTSDAHWANEFDSRTLDSKMTSEDAVHALIDDLKKHHGHAGELASIKVWARWKVIHEPAPILTSYGIFDYPDQLRQYWELMEEGDTADAQYATDFDSRLWESQYTSEQAVIDFIKGLQKRQGRRAGAMCATKVWGRWKAVDEPKILAAQASLPSRLATSPNQGFKYASLYEPARELVNTHAGQMYSSHSILGDDMKSSIVDAAEAPLVAPDDTASSSVKSSNVRSGAIKAGSSGALSAASTIAQYKTPLMVAGGLAAALGAALVLRKALA